MTGWQLHTPIVFIIFKRFDTTQKVFEAIRRAKPPKLLVIADGARENRPGEIEACSKTRSIIDQIDWDCEVLKNYSEINLGCAKRVSSGLDWVFEYVDQAIILEDDCLPDPSFFRFCEELLEIYKTDNRVFSISGQNVQFSRSRTKYSYYFSRYQHCWGWATWKRAWQYFDFDLPHWIEVKESNLLADILGDPIAVKRWTKEIEATLAGEIDSWATRWMVSCWLQSGLSILSNTNLISNIGFGNSSTNTDYQDSPYASMQVSPVDFPIRHPPFMVRNVQADAFTQQTLYNSISFPVRIKAKLKKVFRLVG
jgi:hypothetical protein